MTKPCAKIGGRETLKDGVISKLQRHFVWQGKLLIVIHLFSWAHDKRLLVPSVLSPDPMSQLGHHTLTFNDVYTSVK